MINQELIKNHIAVSSLESYVHATRKDPKIIHAVWFIGKRCNYSCSYCSPFLHDNYSPHINLDDAISFVNELSSHCYSQNKEIKFSITGGEPFVHPKFLEIVSHIKSIKNVMMLSVVSNGSLPYDLYLKSTKYITNLTISLHLEQPKDVIDEILEKILKLNQINALFLNVNVMAVPGKLEQVKKIEKILKENAVNYIVRKIDPPEKELPPTTTKQDFIKNGENIHKYFQNKIDYKNQNNQNFDHLWKEYYSAEELEYLSTANNQTWNNIRLHGNNEYIETNTDTVKSKNLNIWKDWLCYIGIDTLNIQFDGTIWRGQCMTGEPIGKIGSYINWPKNPVVCPIKYCDCNADMLARKTKSKEYLNIVNDND